MTRAGRRLAGLGVALALLGSIHAWQDGAGRDLFVRQEVMIPMRDGVRLQTVIFTPKEARQPLPILLRRTPYGVPEDEAWAHTGNHDELIADGYIFVVQNIRGRFGSEGQFVMIRPPHAWNDSSGVDETTDAYDTVDWLVRNVPGNNGRVGMWGISYDAWTAVMALLGPHPALKAVSEQASPGDMFLGDDFHHNGAFRLSYGFEYSAELETSRNANTLFQFGNSDTYSWYLGLGALSHVNPHYFHGQIPTWNDFVDHPNRDSFWLAQSFDTLLHSTPVPLLNVAGWWDQEDFYGPQRAYELLEAQDGKHYNYFVAGPWNHGGWSYGRGDHLGPVEFGSDTAKYFRSQVQAPWFAYWLHGRGELREPEALTFQTGSNQWRSHAAWPPREGITARRLYFRAGHRLSFEPARETGGEAFDTYVSDPANPVPYRPRPVPPTYPGPEWRVWLLQDQRFVEHRPDVLSWKTEPLKHAVTVTGEIVADLFASTSGTDSDWIVKLIDVYPSNYRPPELLKQPGYPDANLDGGYELMIADEVFRGRFRSGFARPEPIPANRVEEYKFSLHTNDHVFQKGHRIMVQVESSWFPLIDRNPQKFVENIFQAQDSDYQKAHQRIYRSARSASSVILPVAAQ